MPRGPRWLHHLYCWTGRRAYNSCSSQCPKPQKHSLPKNKNNSPTPATGTQDGKTTNVSKLWHPRVHSLSKTGHGVSMDQLLIPKKSCCAETRPSRQGLNSQKLIAKTGSTAQSDSSCLALTLRGMRSSRPLTCSIRVLPNISGRKLFHTLSPCWALSQFSWLSWRRERQQLVAAGSSRGRTHRHYCSQRGAGEKVKRREIQAWVRKNVSQESSQTRLLKPSTTCTTQSDTFWARREYSTHKSHRYTYGHFTLSMQLVCI